MDIIGRNLYIGFKNGEVKTKDKIQNKFTAYINRAIHGSKNKYLKQKIRYESMMSPFFDFIDIQKESLFHSENLIYRTNERKQYCMSM